MAGKATTAAVSLALIVVMLGVSACSSPEERVAKHLARGQEYLADRNFDKARVEFRNALQIAPDDADARYLSGRVSEMLGNVREAAGLYQATIEVDPDHVLGRANLGRVFVFAGGPEKALETIEPGLAKHPQDPDLLTVRGAARAQLGDRLAALEDAETAVRLAPGNENAVALLASLYRQDQRSDAAIRLLRESIERVPDAADLHQVLATLYLDSNQMDEAEATMRALVKLRPRELAYRYQLALACVRAGRVDAADQVLRDAIEQLPDDDNAKLAYVDFLATQRSRADGEKALRAYIARHPRDYDLQLGLGALQQRFGAEDDAIGTYSKIVAADGDGPKANEARARIAAVRLTQGRLDEAQRLVDEVLAANPRDNDALIIRGNLALERGDPAAAISDLRAVLRDQPAAVGILRTLAQAHRANGDMALAEEHLRAALEAEPTDREARVELARTLAETGRVDQSVALLEDAVRAAPQDPVARETLIRAYVSQGDLAAARSAAEDLKILRPDAPASSYLAGLVAEAQGNRDVAALEFERALQLQPGAMDVIAALARVELARGRAVAALARVDSFIEREPDNAAAHNLRGELLLATGSRDRAIAAFTRAKALAPKWWLPYRNLALAQMSAKDDAAAIGTFVAGVEASGYEPALVADLATVYERMGRPDDAIAQYEALLARNPRLQFAANNLAMMLVTYRTDRASLDRALALTANFDRSSSAALLDTRGWVHFKRGENADALPLLERAQQAAPDSPVIRYHLAKAQLQAGQREQARENLATALQGTSSFTGANEAKTLLAMLQTEKSEG